MLMKYVTINMFSPFIRTEMLDNKTIYTTYINNFVTDKNAFYARNG